jgi:hypothetical protein
MREQLFTARSEKRGDGKKRKERLFTVRREKSGNGKKRVEQLCTAWGKETGNGKAIRAGTVCRRLSVSYLWSRQRRKIETEMGDNDGEGRSLSPLCRNLDLI